MYVSVARVQEVTARKFKVPLRSMKDKNNRGEGHNGRNAFEFSRPRQVAMYIAWEITSKSKNQIGKMFGGRDHTTVIHAIRAVEKRLETDKVLWLKINAIKLRLLSVDNPPPTACRVFNPESLNCPMSTPTKPEWYTRQSEERKSVSVAYTEIMRREAVGPKVRDEDRVYRDPCVKCGTRGDIGCVHTRVAA